MSLAATLAARPRLNNLYFDLATGARVRHAHKVYERFVGARPEAHAAANFNADPLRTRQIVANYQSTLEKRIDRTRSLARRTVLHSMQQGALHVEGVQDGSVGEFHPLNPDLAAAEFHAWSRATMMEVVLDSTADAVQLRHGHFLIGVNAQTVGVAAVQAYDKAKKAGITISDELETFVARVRSVEAAEVAATRQFGLLRNMSFDAAADMRDELVQGLRVGKSAEEIAQAIDARLSSINLTRARVIARTEITNAHANATLNAYQISGVQALEALVEFALQVHGTAAPCPQCVSLAGHIYTIDAARGIIPVHANCQCGWVPVSRR